jgi:GNAT superfamily N-acetyltransferase
MFTWPIAITSQHDTRDFDCGNTALNEYLKKYALANSAAGLAKTFVVGLEKQPAIVVGYYSIAAGSVEKQHASPRATKGTPNYAIPVVLLGRFAVDVKYQGNGLGRDTLYRALRQITDASEILGIRAVLVHAKNEKAANFYKRHGFEATPIDLQLMLLLKDMRKMLAASTAAASAQSATEETDFPP